MNYEYTIPENASITISVKDGVRLIQTSTELKKHTDMCSKSTLVENALKVAKKHSLYNHDKNMFEIDVCMFERFLDEVQESIIDEIGDQISKMIKNRG